MVGRHLIDARPRAVSRAPGQPPGPAMGDTPHAAQVARRAVGTIWTRESGSSTQSTGTSLDTQSEPLGRDEQLGIEEPLVVLDQGQQFAGRPLAAAP